MSAARAKNLSSSTKAGRMWLKLKHVATPTVFKHVKVRVNPHQVIGFWWKAIGYSQFGTGVLDQDEYDACVPSVSFLDFLSLLPCSFLEVSIHVASAVFFAQVWEEAGKWLCQAFRLILGALTQGLWARDRQTESLPCSSKRRGLDGRIHFYRWDILSLA